MQSDLWDDEADEYVELAVVRSESAPSSFNAVHIAAAGFNPPGDLLGIEATGSDPIPPHAQVPARRSEGQLTEFTKRGSERGVVHRLGGCQGFAANPCRCVLRVRRIHCRERRVDRLEPPDLGVAIGRHHPLDRAGSVQQRYPRAPPKSMVQDSVQGLQSKLGQPACAFLRGLDSV
jgi:hypothetical protein